MTAPGWDCQVYLLTPPALPDDFETQLAAALDEGGVAAVQLRLKNVDDDIWARDIARLQTITTPRNIALIINDRPDLAVKYGADGAHVGGEDMTIAEARNILGKQLQLGVSCYNSRDLAMSAGESGADYIAFGSFFPSQSKQTNIAADLDLLQWWAEMMELPVVAIGGITAANCAPLVRAGANFLAVISAVWDHPEGPAAGVRALNQAIAGS
jgi:thiamine-phosphate pyrophosphorylase